MSEHFLLRQTYDANSRIPRQQCSCGAPWPCQSAWRVVLAGEPIGQRAGSGAAGVSNSGSGYVTVPAPSDGVLFTEGLFVSDEDLANMRLAVAATRAEEGLTNE